MDIKKLNPWNWFKHEEKQPEQAEIVPVKQGDYPQPGTPFTSMMQLHRDIDRLFDNAFRGFPSSGRSLLGRQMGEDNFLPSFHASVNVASDDKQYTITLEAPGMQQKDITIELQDRVLCIKGNKQQGKEEEGKHYYRIERHYGSFERMLSIPDDGDVKSINATMKDGVLTVAIPRTETSVSKVKKIEISG